MEVSWRQRQTGGFRRSYSSFSFVFQCSRMHENLFLERTRIGKWMDNLLKEDGAVKSQAKQKEFWNIWLKISSQDTSILSQRFLLRL